MEHKLGITVGCISGEDSVLTLDRIKNADFNTVFISTEDIDNSVRIKKRADELGLETEFIHAPFRGINDMWLDDDTVPDIFLGVKHTIDVAKEANIPVIILHVSSGWKAPAICDKGLARFDAIVDYAKKNGITVAFENLRKVGNLAYLVDRYEDFDNVRFCYDCGHEYGYTRFVSFPDIFREKIICTHIHDNLGYEYAPDDPDLHLLPFDGTCDYKDTMKRLHKYSYSGPLSLEVSTKAGKGKYIDTDPDEFIATCFERIKKISEM